jgi:hypothetical protein
MSGRPGVPPRAATALVALAAAVVLAGCGIGARPPAGSTPDGVAAPEIVMIIRHGEKPAGSTSGVDADGNEDDSSLTAAGWERAHRLVELFDPAQGSPRPGLARPRMIYAAGANDDGEGQRTRETVTLLADRLGMGVNTDFGKGDEEKLVEHVIAQPGPTLICWQHGEIPAIAEAFPGVAPAPPAEWPDDRFDVVWVFTRTATGWHFAQQPELVLPQDRADGIEN